MGMKLRLSVYVCVYRCLFAYIPLFLSICLCLSICHKLSVRPSISVVILHARRRLDRRQTRRVWK